MNELYNLLDHLFNSYFYNIHRMDKLVRKDNPTPVEQQEVLIKLHEQDVTKTCLKFLGFKTEGLKITLVGCEILEESTFNNLYPKWSESVNDRYINLPINNYILINKDGTYTTIINDTGNAWCEDHESLQQAFDEVFNYE